MRHLILTFCLIFFPCAAANAATLTVTNTTDSGGGSLRQAIADAAPGDTINLSVTGTITLTSGQLIIDKNLTIQGPGQSLLSISGNQVSMVFFINNGLNEPTVTFDGMTIKDANHTYSEEGGGISNYGYLTVTNCMISGNGASNGHGGGVWNQVDASMTITNSTISGNGAYYDGGGIRNDGNLTIINSVISGNGADGGGGIYNLGTLTVIDSTISGNSAQNFGAISSGGGTVIVSNSTISDNAANSGGGIGSTATLTVTNSRISGNTSYYNGSGGIDNWGALIVNNSTISDNTDSYGIGGIARIA